MTRRKPNPNGRRKPPKVTLPVMPTQWDQGADGPANRVRLRAEPATDIDPETGRETPNPNGICRHRREPWVRVYHRKGKLTDRQLSAAEKLRMAADGMRERDPLAALGEIRLRSSADRQARQIDARRWFRELWDAIPRSSRPIIERVVLDDQPVWHGNPAMRERHISRLASGLDAIA